MKLLLTPPALTTATLILLLSFATSASAQYQLRLIDAVKNQDFAAFSVALDRGSHAEEAEADGTTALHWAVHRNNMDMAKKLIEIGADISAENRYGVAPLSLAAVNGNADMANLLLSGGADANTSLPENETVLMTAARTGVAEVVQLLLDNGARVNETESWRNQTALMWAAGEGNLEVVKTLLANGADISARSSSGFTALLFAAREGHSKLIQALLAAGAPIDEALPARAAIRNESGMSAAEQSGMTALILAAANAHYDTASLLLDAGADPNHSPLGWSLLHQLTWVRKAGQAGSNNPAPPGSGAMGSLEFARKLVSLGADVNSRVTSKPPVGVTELNMTGGTPFLLAARTADADFMKLLIELGADPNIPNEDNSSVLMVAAGLGTGAPGEDPGTESEVMEAVQLVLSLGADVNAVDDNGETAMHGAAYKHVPRVVQYLYDSGAEISIWNQENEYGWTPLHIVQGIHRGMSIVSSRTTEAAIQRLIDL